MIRVAEFFAGIGLVRLGLERSQKFEIVFANDVDPSKKAIYDANFYPDELLMDDIANLFARDIPKADLATASFPCTDLSLAGNRQGLNGSRSGTFWEFTRILDEMGVSRPSAVLIENVVGFGSSNGGDDLAAAITELNRLGYSCDLLVLDAKRFVPQSRPRLFVVGLVGGPTLIGDWSPIGIRPGWIERFVAGHPDLRMAPRLLPSPPENDGDISTIVERLDPMDGRWWDEERVQKFNDSLSKIQADRLQGLIHSQGIQWRTAYRRTRAGVARWEVRADAISGCLRTSSGGSSKQALVEAGDGEMRIRWMTPKEYAALQGAPDFDLHGVSVNKALYALGDAVCVNAVTWVGDNYLEPELTPAKIDSPVLSHA